MSASGTSLHSRHCKILAAIGQQRTLRLKKMPDRISERPPRGGLSVSGAYGSPRPWRVLRIFSPHIRPGKAKGAFWGGGTPGGHN